MPCTTLVRFLSRVLFIFVFFAFLEGQVSAKGFNGAKEAVMVKERAVEAKEDGVGGLYNQKKMMVRVRTARRL